MHGLGRFVRCPTVVYLSRKSYGDRNPNSEATGRPSAPVALQCAPRGVVIRVDLQHLPPALERITPVTAAHGRVPEKIPSKFAGRIALHGRPQRGLGLLGLVEPKQV